MSWDHAIMSLKCASTEVMSTEFAYVRSPIMKTKLGDTPATMVWIGATREKSFAEPTSACTTKRNPLAPRGMDVWNV